MSRTVGVMSGHDLPSSRQQTRQLTSSGRRHCSAVRNLELRRAQIEAHARRHARTGAHAQDRKSPRPDIVFRREGIEPALERRAVPAAARSDPASAGRESSAAGPESIRAGRRTRFPARRRRGRRRSASTCAGRSKRPPSASAEDLQDAPACGRRGRSASSSGWRSAIRSGGGCANVSRWPAEVALRRDRREEWPECRHQRHRSRRPRRRGSIGSASMWPGPCLVVDLRRCRGRRGRDWCRRTRRKCRLPPEPNPRHASLRSSNQRSASRPKNGVRPGAASRAWPRRAGRRRTLRGRAAGG